MAQFQVPQFIETEDKIIGSMTLKQFAYIAAAGMLSFLLFFVLRFGFWLVITVILSISAASLAFLKYNGQPLPKILGSAIKYTLYPKLYLWKRTTAQTEPPEINVPELRSEAVSPLKRIWLKINTVIHPIQQRSKEKKMDSYRQTIQQKQMARRVDYR
ncbi:MAG: PrgI family protein [Patescibacteria group bacterium]